ncbi:MAG: amidohydrolase family protein [Polyangiales bacterium]
MGKRSWITRRKKTQPELPYQPPIWLGDHSNGELYHAQTPREAMAEHIILREGAERARYYGMERREFMASGLGMALSMSVLNLVNGCGSGEKGGFDPGNGAFGGSSGSGLPPVPQGGAGSGAPGAGGRGGSQSGGVNTGSGGAGAPGGAAGGGSPGAGGSPSAGGVGGSGTGGSSGMGDIGTMPDPVECETALDYKEMFIFDVQTHRVERANATYQTFLSILPQAQCGKGLMGCFTQEEYTRQFFLESDTTMTVLSGIPATDGNNPLTNEEIAMTRDFVRGVASNSDRVITHAMILPNYNHEAQIAAMPGLMADNAPLGAWKCYTPWGPGNGTTGFWLDDEATGIPFIEQGRMLGVKTFCCHKGLPLPGFDNNYGDPKDIGVVAKAYPDCNFVVYHSAYRFGNGDERTGYTTGNKDGVNSLVTALMDNGLGLGSNVYGELGSTWNEIKSDVTAATHVLGKLLKFLGEDNIVWGTDCMWYGSPQPQIMMFMSFKMDETIRMQEGYPDLTPQIKAKILGLNAAKVFGIDPAATRCGIAEGDLARAKREFNAEFGRYTWAFQKPVMRTRRDYLFHAAFHRAAKTPG